jgi:hypothetical protein
MQNISDLKLLLLQIIEDSFQQEPNIQATQQMGINMSNAVKKDGVVIIQNQNVEIYSKIIPSLVKALKMCDALQEINRSIVYKEPIEIEPPIEIQKSPVAIDSDPVNDFCSWMFEHNLKWSEMQDLVKSRYLEFILTKFSTKNEAAKWLGVGGTYLCKLTRTPKTDV